MIAYLCAYWDYLRGVRKDEPKPAEHGLDETTAEVLRRQCCLEAVRLGLDPAI